MRRIMPTAGRMKGQPGTKRPLFDRHLQYSAELIVSGRMPRRINTLDASIPPGGRHPSLTSHPPP
jgi:hypothetical protein